MITEKTAEHVNPVDFLWGLIMAPTIDPATLTRGIESALMRENLDWRTMQLIKEGWDALEQAAGSAMLDRYLLNGTAHEIRETILARTSGVENCHGEIKFPSLKERLMTHLSPVFLGQFLRELGTRITRPTTITMGGAASLVLQGLISRATEDIDLVDEVPVEIREEHQMLEELSSRYGLRIAHFQSHYLPERWQTRTADFGTFGKIHLRLVDPHDIIAGKVYSPRPKDLDDFRLLAPSLDNQRLRELVIRGLSSLWSSNETRQRAIQNWYVVYGENLELE